MLPLWETETIKLSLKINLMFLNGTSVITPASDKKAQFWLHRISARRISHPLLTLGIFTCLTMFENFKCVKLKLNLPATILETKNQGQYFSHFWRYLDIKTQMTKLLETRCHLFKKQPQRPSLERWKAIRLLQG